MSSMSLVATCMQHAFLHAGFLHVIFRRHLAAFVPPPDTFTAVWLSLCCCVAALHGLLPSEQWWSDSEQTMT